MSNFEDDLLDGLAQAIAAAGIATYRPDGTAYAPGETAIVFDEMPTSPDRIVCLATYGNTDEQPRMAVGTVMVQIRTRGLPGQARDVRQLATDVFTALHGLTHRDFGATHLNQFLRASAVPMGKDDSLRWERSDNYRADLDTLSTPLRPE